MRMQHKVSASLRQALEKLKLSENAAEKNGENRNLSSPCFLSFNISMFLFCFVVVFVLYIADYHPLPSTSCYSTQEGHVDS